MVSGSVQPQGEREKPKRAEDYDGRDQPQIGAQLFSLPLRPHHIEPWHHISAAARRTSFLRFSITADIQVTCSVGRKQCCCRTGSVTPNRSTGCLQTNRLSFAASRRTIKGRRASAGWDARPALSSRGARVADGRVGQ